LKKNFILEIITIRGPEILPANVQHPTMTIFTKNPCPLCDEAKEALLPLQHRFTLKEVDITKPENGRWFGLYRYEIPVFHFEGRFLMKHKVNPSLLEDVLKDYENKMKK